MFFRGGGIETGKSRPRRKKGSPRAGATPQGSTNDAIGTMAGDDEQRQPLLGNESQGDYGASTSGGAPPAAEGESREAMEAREIAYACKTGPGGLSSAEAAERL